MIRKRELASYILLWRTFNGKKFNINHAINVLELFMSRKVAFHVFRNLRKFGMVKKVNELNFIVEDPKVWFWNYVKEYLASRLHRNLKCKGFSGFKVSIENDKIVVKGLKLKIDVEMDFLSFSE